MSGELRVICAPHDIRGKKNSTGGTIVKGTVVKLSAATDDLIVVPTAIADAHYGVAMNDVLDGSMGDFQIGGQAIVRVGTGGVVRGDRLTHDSAGFGRVFTAAPGGGTNNALIGIANRTQATVGGLTEVELARPGTMLQG
jgi:hypothetical protein